MPLLPQEYDPSCFACDPASTSCITGGGPPGPAGPAGAAGTPGTNGIDAFTLTTAQFIVPAPNADVTVSVANSQWMTAGQVVFVQFAGYYLVNSLPDNLSVSIKNLGYSGNAIAGAVIASSSKVSPSGPSGASGSATGLAPIGNAVDAITITGLGLAVAPTIAILTVLKPNGGLNIFATARAPTLTTDGFTADLSGVTDSGSYSLCYLLV